MTIMELDDDAKRVQDGDDGLREVSFWLWARHGGRPIGPTAKEFDVWCSVTGRIRRIGSLKAD